MSTVCEVTRGVDDRERPGQRYSEVLWFGAEGQGFVWNRCYAATVKVHHLIRDHKKVANHCLEILIAILLAWGFTSRRNL